MPGRWGSGAFLGTAAVLLLSECGGSDEPSGPYVEDGALVNAGAQ